MRAVLLSDSKVKEFLSDRVIPVWESVRDVPKVTIDFGEGKKIERTLKGNTVLYLCAPDGRVIDAYPGVYTPQDFLKEINKGLALAKPEQLGEWHRMQVMNDLGNDPAEMTMSKVMVESPLLKLLAGTALAGPPKGRAEPANDQPISLAKRAMEGPIVKSGPPIENDKAKLAGPPELVEAFDKLTARLVDVSDIPLSTRETRAMAGAAEGMTPEQLGMLAIQKDSKQNLRFVRPAVHLMLAAYAIPPRPDEVKDLIFKRILHVKIDDPYLGLDDVALPGTRRGG